ncbi:MAG: helix-turn-helix transcriptional regulator [Halofilum sp. (in: g-proteobacteria)]|nr:helix-turn-helix transcriptional regulator [Halofilum sp. (in: g-proteobacteria)]
MSPLDRHQAVAAFRARLLGLIGRSGESRSAFAARVGMDRSTLSQLLSADNERLPRAETVLAIAQAGAVSCDWLLGLTQDEHAGTELLRADMEIESGAASPVDERLARWHREASGYKIRYIPTTLPDLLKTEAVIRYECPELADLSPEASLEQAAYRLSYSRHPDTEMEVCCARQSLVSFARGEGVWSGLRARERRAQIERMARLAEELYPTFRWYLYDGLRHFSAPVTLLGPQRAVLYVGNLYFVFNTTEHIRVLTAHFDALVKVATVQPADMPAYLAGLRDEVG